MNNLYKKILLILFLCLLPFITLNNYQTAKAMPYYDLKPQKLCVKSEFFTSYFTSSDERITNIKLASSKINGTFLDIGEEFSFNKIVGVRNEQNGFKTAKIIVNGKFVDGVGGGVCQVSTTLYNAVLLADLKVTEFHPHSLPVSYIAPSFDAMVNSYTSDFKFVNNTNNPIIIYSKATDSQIKFTIVGEPNQYEIIRDSKEIEILPVENEFIKDENNEFLDLYEGEQKIISYGKAGLKSQGYLIYKKNGKISHKKLIRQDKYNSTKNLIVEGTQQRPIDDEKEIYLNYPLKDVI